MKRVLGVVPGLAVTVLLGVTAVDAAQLVDRDSPGGAWTARPLPASRPAPVAPKLPPAPGIPGLRTSPPSAATGT